LIDLRLGRWQDALADVPDGSVRLILTSPPYDSARTYEGTCEPVDFDEFGMRRLGDRDACERKATADADAIGQTMLFGGAS
jgi:hypothetical protein